MDTLKVNYDLLEMKGKGNFGEVWKAINDDGKTIALKIIKINNNKEAIERELTILRALTEPCHRFVACFYDSFYDKTYYYIESEYIDGVELQVWKKQIKPTDLNKHLVALIKDLNEALKYIHKRNIIHRDIKPANILINKDNNPVLVDFGLACQTQLCIRTPNNIECCMGTSGTPLYFPPELVIYHETYFASDIWSLGGTMYYISTGRYCFNFSDRQTIKDAANMIAYTEPKRLYSDNEKLNYIVNKCLVKNIVNRINSEQITNYLNEDFQRIEQERLEQERRQLILLYGEDSSSEN